MRMTNPNGEYRINERRRTRKSGAPSVLRHSDFGLPRPSSFELRHFDNRHAIQRNHKNGARLARREQAAFGLTMFGITIGVFSVISVMTAIGALQYSIENGLSFLGSNIFQFAKYPRTWAAGGQREEKISETGATSLISRR